MHLNGVPKVTRVTRVIRVIKDIYTYLNVCHRKREMRVIRVGGNEIKIALHGISNPCLPAQVAGDERVRVGGDEVVVARQDLSEVLVLRLLQRLHKIQLPWRSAHTHTHTHRVIRVIRDIYQSGVNKLT